METVHLNCDFCFVIYDATISGRTWRIKSDNDPDGARFNACPVCSMEVYTALEHNTENAEKLSKIKESDENPDENLYEATKKFVRLVGQAVSEYTAQLQDISHRHKGVRNMLQKRSTERAQENIRKKLKKTPDKKDM